MLLCVELVPNAAFTWLDMPERNAVYGLTLICGQATLCLWTATRLKCQLVRARAYEKRADELTKSGRTDELAEHMKAWKAWVDTLRDKL